MNITRKIILLFLSDEVEEVINPENNKNGIFNIIIKGKKNKLLNSDLESLFHYRLKLTIKKHMYFFSFII